MDEERNQFQCEICGKELSRQQTLVQHKLNIHGIQPEIETKRYKLYLKDSNVAVPRTTAFRKRKHNVDDVRTVWSTSSESFPQSLCTEPLLTTSQNNTHINFLGNSDLEHQINTEEKTSSYIVEEIQSDTILLENVDTSTELLSPVSEQFDNVPVLCCQLPETNASNIISDSEHSILSDIDNNSLSSESDESSSDSDEVYSSSSPSDIDTDNENVTENTNSSVNTASKHFTEEQEKSMALLSVLLRYHLGDTGSNDIIRVMNIFNQDCEIKDVNKLKEIVGSTDTQAFEFCDKCYTLYPEDDSIYQCTLEGCKGLRYKRSSNKQHQKKKKAYFTCLFVKQQIQDTLEREGIWPAMVKYRADCSRASHISDLLNASVYRELCQPGNFMCEKYNFTLFFNTDGVPLFKSSGVSIWPVYLVINELPPVMRFSRKNMIIWGIWQSKGKPVFRTFLQPFIQHMRMLRTEGMKINLKGVQVQAKGMLLGGTMDLQAKAYLAEMTQHNGLYGCITCEDPGQVVKQGRGHARVYPHRDNGDIFKDRTTEEFLSCGLAAMETGKPEMGVKGVSALHGLEWFDVVWGLVPDYMHGVLLGVTKMLLKLWFSSSNSGKAYFFGRFIKNVDRYLKKMKPTDDISRLPRKMESNMHHLKASELQMWLLFYSVPCLTGIMSKEYLDHLGLLVEGIYILLSDKITVEQLDHAENVLNTFYASFACLYGLNHCTLNMHNVGLHLASYVRKLGPVWAWSCFAFEDMNGIILESVHGTGEVCYQILWAMQARKRISIDCMHMKNPELKEFDAQAMNTRRAVKIKHETANCKIAGGMKKETLDKELSDKICEVLGIEKNQIGNVSKVGRVVINDVVYFSKFYGRMSKRIGYVVLLNGSKSVHESMIASIQYFLLHHQTNKCVAVITYLKLKQQMALLHDAICHLVVVEPGDTNAQDSVILVDEIQEKLLYMDGNPKCLCISRLPNLYGQLQ